MSVSVSVVVWVLVSPPVIEFVRVRATAIAMTCVRVRDDYV